MTHQITLPPEVEARLLEAAGRRSQSVEQLAGELQSRVPDDPFLLALLLAEEDDEPVTAEDRADIEHTLSQLGTGSGVSHGDLVKLRVLGA